MTWHPPGIVYLDVGCAKAGTGAPQGDRSQGISIWSSHLITPETEHSSHYMFGFARDFSIDDPEMSKMLYEGSKATFLEDADILEAVQTNRTGGSLDGLIHITADAAQLQARRMLTSMIGAEQAPMIRNSLAIAALAALAPSRRRRPTILSVAAGDGRGAVCRRRRLGPAGAARRAEARGEARQAVHHREPARRGHHARRHAGGARRRPTATR